MRMIDFKTLPCACVPGVFPRGGESSACGGRGVHRTLIQIINLTQRYPLKEHPPEHPLDASAHPPSKGDFLATKFNNKPTQPNKLNES
ncbi:hypothetical protein DYD21_11515 [Rhodohalobacter sp. SW132]|nr:hypothetical protein DYD21_11515 [Rhodohalobacter sp. SW132]